MTSDLEQLQHERNFRLKKESEILEKRDLFFRQLFTGIGIAVTFWSTLFAGTIFTQEASFQMQNSAGFMFLSTCTLFFCSFLLAFWYLRLLNNALDLSENRMKLARVTRKMNETDEKKDLIEYDEVHIADASRTATAQASIPNRTQTALSSLVLFSCATIGLTLACMARWIYLVRVDLANFLQFISASYIIIAAILAWAAGSAIAVHTNMKKIKTMNSRVSANMEINSDTNSLT